VFKSTAQTTSAVDPACGATKFLLRQPPRIRERKEAEHSAIWVLSLHAHFVFALLLSVEQANEKGSWCVCVIADMSAL
jgi:hypothetical protein